MKRVVARILRHRYQLLDQLFASVALKTVLVCILICGVFFYTRAYTPTRVMAATSSTLNFQARLMNSGGSLVPDGNYSIQFKLYTAASGGTNEWTETQPTVTVRNGYLSVQLGGITSFDNAIDWSQEKWLTMNVNSDGEMNPRIKLTAVPYSFRSGQAETLTNGNSTLTADDLAQLGPTGPQVVNIAIAALRINQTGAGGFLQMQQNGLDVFTVANNGDLNSAGSATFSGGTLTVGSATQSGGLVIHEGDGNTLTLQTGGQSGSLTFTLPTGYGSSGDCLKGNGGGVLSFSGCAGANSFVNGGNAFGGLATLGTTDSNSLQVITANTQAILIDTSGNVRIGSGSPSEKLDVAGGVRVGNSTGTNAGTIRWNGSDFEGYDGTQWVSFTEMGGNTNASTSFVSGLANVGANVTGAAVEMLMFTTATAVSNTAGVTGFTAPADGSFRTCLVKNTANITGGTLNLRWRVNGVSVGSGACTMNSTTNRQSATALDPGVVTFSAGDTIGIAFDTVGLAPTTNDFTVYWSVEYETTPSGGITSTLQDAYDASNSPAMITTADNKNLIVSLANTATDSNFLVNILSGSSGKFAIQDNGTDAFSVSSSAITLTRAVTVTSGGLDLSSTGITNAGSITGVGANITSTTGLTIASGGSGDLALDSASNKIVLAATDTTLQRNAAGSYTVDLNDGGATTLVLNNSGAGAASLNLSDGGLQTGGTSRLTNTGALQNITGLTVTSGGASITGNVILGGSSSDRITINGQILGSSPLVFQGATDNGFATTFTFTEPTANNTITFPDASGAVVLDSRTITAGTGLSGGGSLSADRTLSLDINGLNSTTAINQTDYVAIYDGGGIKKITRSDFLQGLTGALHYLGTWNASTNTPSISDATGSVGQEYAVAVAGTQNLGSGNITFGVGDFIIHDGTRWQLAPSSSAISTVFGRTGAVTAQSGDYTALQITNTPSGSIAATTVQGALNELDSEKLGSLNGLTAISQTFANDTNVTITSSGSTHTIGWSGQLAVGRGGTGASSFTSSGVLYGNNTGALQATSAGSGGQVLLANSSGVPTFTSLSGDVTIDSSGVTTIGSDKVALGGDTTGDFVASLGTLTGLSTSGNGGEGSTPTLSVLYGSSANTAVQGNITLVCPSGTGNLTGTGNTITLGTGGTCNSLNTAAAVGFTTSVTTPIITNAGGLTLSATGAGNDLTFAAADKIILSGFDCTSFDNGGVLTVNSAGEINCDNDDGGGGGSLTGSGTSGRLPAYTGTTSLGNSWLFQNVSTLELDSGRDFDILGGNLNMAGVTMLDSSRALDNLTGITSTGTITFDSLSAGGLVKADSSGVLSIATAGTDYEVPITFGNGLTRTGNAVALGGALTGATDIALSGYNLVFSGSGNVGIGTSTPNSFKLEVAGNIGPDTDNTRDLGSSTRRFANVYANNLIEKSVTFTPTTVGWYRIATGINMMGGTIRISAPLYDNTLTDLEFQYNISGYGLPGSIQQTRYSSYNNGVVSAARTSTDGAATLYLDIFISSATAPQPITIYGYGPNHPTFVASPTVGAIAGSSSVNFLTLGQGFRSSQGAIFAETGGVVGIGTSATPSALLSVGGTTGNLTVDSSGNLATQGTTRLTAGGALQNITGISTTGSLVFNSFGGSAGLLKVDSSGNVSVTTAGTDYEVPLTFNNGLTRSGNEVKLGGALTGATDIALAGNNLVITGTGTIGLGTNTPIATIKLDVRGAIGVQSNTYSFIGTAAGLDTYGYFRAVNTSDAVGYFELGSYDIVGGSQGGRSLVLNSLGGNVGVGGDLTPDGLFSVGSTSQFQVSSTGAITAVGINSAGALVSLNENSNFNTNINTGSSTGTLTIGGGSSPLIIDTPNLDFDSTNGLSVVGQAQFSTRTYVPGASGTTGQGYFTGSVSTPLSAFQSLDLAGNTYSFFATNKYYNGSAWVDNGLGRVGSSFQIQNDNFTFYSFDTATNFTPRFTVASGGNVGIGLSGAPGALLSVGGTTGNFQVNSSGAISGVGITSAGAAVSLNAGSNFATTINSGSSTGTVTIGGGAAPLVIDSTNFDVSSAGALSGITTISTSSTINGQTISAAANFTGTVTTAGLATFNGGITLQTGDSFTINGDALTDLTSNGLINSGGVLSLDVTTSGTVAGTGSNSGLITAADGLSLLRGCSNNQILKWASGGSGAWNCAADATGISDSRLKTNIVSVEQSMLERIQQVRIVEFDFDCDHPAFDRMHCDTDHQTGVIAQELAEIFPELVIEVNGYYQVRYDALSLYNLKAVGELAQKVDQLDPSSGSEQIKTDGTIRIDRNGHLQNINGITMVSGGASLTGGINNNNGGIIETGAISGATSIEAESLRINAIGEKNLLELRSNDEGVFTVFNNGALELIQNNERAFAARRTSGEDIFRLSTSGGLVQVGSQQADGAAVLLVLDSIDMDGDPPGINGAQYYNLRSQRFRCFQDGVWQNCISNASTEYALLSQLTSWKQPGADQEFPGEPRVWADLSKAQDFRVTMQLKSPAAQSASCYIQYSTSDDGPWQNLAQPGGYMNIDTAGNIKSVWSAITPNARSEVLLRLMCRGGNYTENTQATALAPVFNNVRIHIR